MKNANLLSIHLAILLVGFSALFARLIPQNAMTITFGRVFFASLVLGLFLLLKKQTIKIHDKKDLYFLMLTGIVLAMHWSSFIFSIQIASVAIGTLAFSTFPLFVAFLEPLFFKEPFEVKNILYACLTLVGIGIIAFHAFTEGTPYFLGVFFGLFAGFSYAVTTLLNRRFVSRYETPVILFYQQGCAALVLFPVVLLLRPTFQVVDVGALLIYGVIFTALSQTLFVRGLRTVSGATAGIITSLEPVYAILFSIIFIAEFPRWHEIVGGIIIITVAAYVTRKKANSV